jgi:hypothetical protein
MDGKEVSNPKMERFANLKDLFDEQEGLKNIGEVLMKSKHLPKSGEEFLDDIALKVDTKEILEVVQVFCHKDISGNNRTEEEITLKDLSVSEIP